MTYDLIIKTFDGVDLTVSPFAHDPGPGIMFDRRNGPMQMAPHQALKAPGVGQGSSYVRSQPMPVKWEADAFLHIQAFSSDEAALNSMRTILSPVRGLAYLIAEDEAGLEWRVLCSVERLDQVSPMRFKVVWDVPFPIWEQVEISNQSSFGIQPTPTNFSGVDSGDVLAQCTGLSSWPCYPKLTITPAAQKATRITDFAGDQVIRGIIANRSPNALINEPLNLLVSPAYDHAGSVLDAANGDALLASRSAIVTTITCNAPVGAGLDNPTGMAIIGDGIQNGGAYEQIYYASSDFTGPPYTILLEVERGIGGTTALAWDADTPVMVSRALLNGDDFEVWLDGMRVAERYLAGVNTGDLRCIIPTTAPADLSLTIAEAMTASVPATGSDLSFNEDISKLDPTGGVVTVETTTPGTWEHIAYRAIDVAAKKIVDIQRGAWASSTGIHANGAQAWRVDHLWTTADSKATNPPPSAPIEHRPAFQLAGAGATRTRDNKQVRHGLLTDDSYTSFFDPEHPDRPKMWLPDYYVPPGDINEAEPLNLGSGSLAAAAWSAVPAAGLVQAGRLTFDSPFGFETIYYDLQRRRAIGTRLLGIADDGREVDLIPLGYQVAEVALIGQSVVASARLNRAIMSAVRLATTGHTQTAGLSYSLGANGQSVLTKLVLKHDTPLEAIFLYLSRSTTNNFTFQVLLRDASGATPQLGQLLWAAREWTGNATLTNFPSGSLTESFVWYQFTNALAGNPIIPAGNYWIEVNLLWTSGQLLWGRGDAIQGLNDRAYNTVGPSFGAPAVFYFAHARGGPIQAESTYINPNGGTAGFDNTIIEYTDARCALITRSAFITLYHIDMTITNDQNNLSLRVEGWLPLDEPFVIDCDARTVTWKEGNHYRSLPCMVTPSSGEEWLRIEPGSIVNTFTFDDPAMELDITIEYRARRQ